MLKKIFRQIYLIGLTCLIAPFATTSSASSLDPGKVIAGWVEKISLKDHTFIIKAKLDSGAKTSSIHAENVQIIQRDGKKWVRFNLVLTDVTGVKHTIVMEKPRIRRVRIKDHNEEPDRRPTVALDICFEVKKVSSGSTIATPFKNCLPSNTGYRNWFRSVSVNSAL